MSAGASEVAMGIARGHVDHASDCHNYRLNPDDQDGAECELVSCEFKAMSESLALAIDALVQRKVEEERERICSKLNEWSLAESSMYAAGALNRAAAAIRTPPPATRG